MILEILQTLLQIRRIMRNNIKSGSKGCYSSISLRKGNFRFGFEKKNTYETTVQSSYTNKNEEAKKNKLNIWKEK